MMHHLFDRFYPPTLSAPSLWGKLPCFGDFVHQSVQAQDMASWQKWFTRCPIDELSSHDLALLEEQHQSQRSPGWMHLSIPQRLRNSHPQPWCFVLPPGMVDEAPHLPNHKTVVGVFANSCDQVGRLHPVVIWQSVQANLRDELKASKNWLFWLSQLLQSHTPPFSTPQAPNKVASLSIQISQMWACAHPSFSRGPFGLFHKDLPQTALAQIVEQGLPAGTSLIDAHSESMRGVGQLPWSLESTLPSHGYFWQQAPNGEYISAVKLALGHTS